MASTPTRSRQQYLDIKAQYPDAVLFFRLGDFYEMFDDDAKTVSKELDLVLTARKQRSGPIPMAGVPHHAAEGYIAKLIAKGYKVALCEQIGSTPVKGLMPREVVRVFTAGTVIEAGMLDSGRNNYLVSVVRDGDRAGLAYADITTGEFSVTQLDSRRALTEELARLEPAELIVPDDEHSLKEEAKVVYHYPTLRFERSFAEGTLRRHFEVSALAGYGVENKPLAIRAAGGALSYLKETQRGALQQIQGLSYYNTDAFMALDQNTRRSLELTESLAGEKANSLLGVLNRTITPMGTRLLRERVTRPLVNLDLLEQRLDQVAAFAEDSLLRADMRKQLRNVSDLERLINRVVSARANPRDLEQIALTLEALPDVQKLIIEAPDLFELGGEIDLCTEVHGLIRQAIVENAPVKVDKIGFMCSGFSSELDGVMSSSAHARDYINSLEARERKRTGIDKLKVGFNKVFGYYIEITRAKSGQAPDDYIRKQTLVNAERYITPEMKEYETLILNAEEQILAIERRLFTSVCEQVGTYATRLIATAQALSKIDVAAALAEVAVANEYARPELSLEMPLIVEQGRHPVVERSLQLERFVPNDINIGRNDRIHIITGPNMSGKSTYIRQVAMITLMAQIGSFVPAARARVGLVDRIFTRIGAHDELHAGRSTFMVEMVESAEILNHATRKSLLILDEIGRGTSTYDGLSIAWAIIEYLHNHPRLKPRTLFATHYHELVGLADLLPLVANYNVAVADDGESIAFLHQIIKGGADRSYGIHVAQLAGLPRDVVRRANEILKELEDHAPTTAIEPSHLKTQQQMVLFPETSPLMDELETLDVLTMTPLEAMNKLFEWKQRFVEKESSKR
ncbi:MAG: DNA mismatch repair protein MutS [Candidatus Promineifilaceae bacterium]